MIEKINLEDQSNYRLNKISKINVYFNEEIQYQQSLTNKLKKYLTLFDILSKIFNSIFNSLFIY